MERKIACLCLLLALIIFGAGCTKKDNLTGNNWSDIRPQTFFDDASFDLGFSFGSEVPIKGDEANLLCGDYNDIQSAIVIQFKALPDSFQIPATRSYADSSWLQLTVIRKNQAARNPSTLSLWKLNSHWKEDAAQEVMNAPLIQIGEAFTLPDSISTSGTDVRIPIPVSFLNSLNEANEDSLSIVIKTNPGAYAEIRSRSTGRGPLLRFKYRNINSSGTVATTDSEYSSRAVKDSYWVKGLTSNLLADQWIIGNLSPSRIFVRWLDDWNHFKDQNGNTLSEARRKQVTINKAELIFHTKTNPYYGGSTAYSLRADRVDRDSINAPMALVSGDLSVAGMISSMMVKSDSVVVDITSSVQGFVNGKKNNKGMVIRSTQEMQNYGILELYHFLNAPAGKKPKLKVTYTAPWL